MEWKVNHDDISAWGRHAYDHFSVACHLIGCGEDLKFKKHLARAEPSYKP